MKLAHALAGLVLLLAAGTLVRAQNVLYTARVKDPTAEVRSGPSTKPEMYATNRLRAGDEVEVVKELEGGWLAIRPPRSSFSWINARFVERRGAGPYHVVLTHDDAPVPVRIGSEVVDEKPSVEGARVGRGSLVVAVGKEQVADDGKWLPIEPPPGEMRFIRAEAVIRGGETPPPPPAPPAGNVAGAPPGPGPAAGTLTSAPGGTAAPAPPAGAAGNTPAAGAGAVAPPPAPDSPEGLMQQAEQAEQSGQIAEAERLYSEVVRRFMNTRHDLAMRCCNRLQFLRDNAKKAASQIYHTASRSDANPPGGDSRLAPVPVSASGQPLNCCVPYGQPPTQSGYARPGPQPTLAPQWSGAGFLRRSGRPVDYRPAYVLENSAGQVLSYVTAAPGVDLDGYLNRNVDLFGRIGYRGDLRANYMIAERVAPLP
jgi:hypothetical protein